VVLSFIKTRCSSCKAEVPELKRVNDKYHDDVAILSISIDSTYDTDEQLLKFMNETGITWRVARGTENVKNDYNAETVPKTFIIDKSGYIRFKHNGEIAEESLSQEIAKML
jgi:cytochrome oxidase Cu insertion factor (SCO1/SenC/PrrC family)